MLTNDFLITIDSDNNLQDHLESDANTYPLTQSFEDSETRNIIIILGRIYYQKDLLEKFQTSLKNSQVNIAQTILTLFQNYGLSVLENLEGEFCLAIGDRQNQKIIVMRDPLGSYPLYWLQNNSELQISSSIALLTKNNATTLNLEYIGHYLTFSFAFSELPIQSTIFNPIKRVLPGEILQLNPSGMPKLLAQYNWQNSSSSNLLSDLTEAGKEFRELLSTAINERIQYGKVSAHLSGGMDSSTVISLTKPQLTSPLTTLSLVYDLDTLVKETDYINLVIKQEKDLDFNLIQADSLLDFQWFNQPLPHHDEPYAGLFHFAIENSLIQKAVALEINTVFTGTGAELVAEGNRYYLADLLHQGQWQQAFQESQKWAIARNQSFWSIFSESALFPLLPPFLRIGLPTLSRQGYGQWPNLGQFEIAPWINKDFAKTYHLYKNTQQILTQLSSYPIEQSMDRFAISCMSGNWAAWFLAKPQGIHISNPFLDPRLIRFCLSLPRSLRTIPGETKPLLKQAMKGLLPEAILQRKYKGNFNEPYWKGLNQQLPHLIQMIKDSTLNQEFMIFDQDKLIIALEQHALGIGDIANGSHLCRILSLIVWHNNQEKININ
jgi:asparagine synthase (glutamine-hydrolysing)